MMQVPNAEQIETAIDQLNGPTIPQWLRDSQKKELHSAGPEGYATKDFANGYELGLQTARVVIAQSVVVQLKGINPSDLL
jgi:hypothetical protein